MSKPSEAGFTLIESILMVGGIGLLAFAIMQFSNSKIQSQKIVNDHGELHDLDRLIRSKIDCDKTFANPAVDPGCKTGASINLLDENGTVFCSATQCKIETIELRSNCTKSGFANLINLEYRRNSTTSSNTWKTLTRVPLACNQTCIEQKTPLLPSKIVNGKYVHNIFFKNVAVNNGGLVNFVGGTGLTPYPISPSSELSSTILQISPSAILAQGPSTDLEILGFAHQFDSGLDTCEISFETVSHSGSDKGTPNIYSRDCYLIIKNIRKAGQQILGDISMESLSFEPLNPTNFIVTTAIARSADPTVADAQDGTSFLTNLASMPPSAARKQFNNVNLSGLKVKITLGADTYDSDQYRAIRANIVTPKVQPPAICN